VHAADQYALRILRAGARGYLSKQTASDELVDAVRKVHAGQKYLSDDVSKQLAFQLIGDRADFSPVESLSDRELQVLCLIANGAKTSEIGDELCLSVKTISTYRGRVLDKLHLRNNADLTRFAMKNNLVR
jgi:DNA-binding NarL/FixJ family response regulator